MECVGAFERLRFTQSYLLFYNFLNRGCMFEWNTFVYFDGFCRCLIIVVCLLIANIAAAVGGIMFYIAFFPYNFLEPNYENMSLNDKCLACISFNLAMSYGMKTIGMYEASGMSMNVVMCHGMHETPCMSLNVVICHGIYETPCMPLNVVMCRDMYGHHACH